MMRGTDETPVIVECNNPQDCHCTGRFSENSGVNDDNAISTLCNLACMFLRLHAKLEKLKLQNTILTNAQITKSAEQKLWNDKLSCA